MCSDYYRLYLYNTLVAPHEKNHAGFLKCTVLRKDCNMMYASNNAMPQQQIYRVTPDLPPFMSDLVVLWFAQAKLQFNNSRFTQEAMIFTLSPDEQ